MIEQGPRPMKKSPAVGKRLENAPAKGKRIPRRLWGFNRQPMFLLAHMACDRMHTNKASGKCSKL
jgi:hypothetical protein